MTDEFDIFILPDGTIRFLYADALRPFLEIGSSVIRRASHIEAEKEAEWVWYADLAPVSGPKLGPFLRRDDAIEAEIEWLVQNHLDKA